MSGEVLMMKKPVGRCALGDVREATSGRVVVLPRVWGVGEPDGLVASRLARPNAGISPLRETVKLSRSGRDDRGLGEGSGRDDGAVSVQASQEERNSEESEVAFYRKYTEALLRRYQRMRMSTARVPSPMDREMFRGRMSHYKVQGFDDAVIFCVDVERCFARLNAEDQRLVRRVAVQQYTMGEAAGVLGLSLRSSIVLYRRALDRMTRLFLEARLLEPQKELSRG